MLKKIILLLLILPNMLVVFSQETEKITVKSGDDIAAVLSSYGMYRFQAFTDGTVVLRNGTSVNAKMNYNIYLGLIQFIDAKGDTLALSNPETTDSISVDNHLFYYHRKYYFQVMANYENCKLVMKQKIEFRPVKVGAYGTYSPGTSAQTYESLSTPYVVNSKLRLNEDIIVIKETIYYLFYKKYREEKASRQGYLTVFPNHKNEIQVFIKENKTNFNKLGDLQKLTAFCAALK